MNYIEPIKNNVANYLWNKDFTESNILSNKEILKVASILNSSYIDNHLIDLPKLVVVGTQSSGKSSLLNSLIGMDILPVGKSMTTRTPLHLELIQSSNENRIEFGYYNNYNWVTDKKILITYPNLDLFGSLSLSQIEMKDLEFSSDFFIEQQPPKRETSK